MIDRRKLLERNSPRLAAWDPKSPLSVGNGEFAFTADITGLQTFYEAQRCQSVPLCTMSQWGWHSTPAGKNRDCWYVSEDVKKTAYESPKGTVYYASEVQNENEEVYHWLRENPHRLNLARIGFLWDGKEIAPDEVEEVEQTLHLYEGRLSSHFVVGSYVVDVETICAGSADVLGIRVCSEALCAGRLSVLLAFPYGSKDISGSDWEQEERHETQIQTWPGRKAGARSQIQSAKGKKPWNAVEENGADVELLAGFYRVLDRDSYEVVLNASEPASLTQMGKHAWRVESGTDTLELTAGFYDCAEEIFPPENFFSFSTVAADSQAHWARFWEECGMIDLHDSTDERAPELERRLVLSEYLLAIQSLGSVPPAETGLTCNSWYGKFHLEMYPWHCAGAALWNEPERLKKSLLWYKMHLPEAKKNAACNGYRGARWPKMVDANAIDSPSPIATLLIWQQPHVIWMLALVYGREWKLSDGQRTQPGEVDSSVQAREQDCAALEEFWDVIRESARFMCAFVAYNDETGCYDLPAPLIPAQEEHDPRTTKNPAYELGYWSFALETAAELADALGHDSENWREVAAHMAPLPERDGLYLACETCPETFTRFNRDHPSMTAAYGRLPGKHVEPEKMRATLKKVLECWDYSSMWGWDFAMLAMTAVRLGDPETAVEILLKDTPKNTYVASGNNYQGERKDLPLYLPGNGSLLLAAAMMTAGYQGCTCELPGFPKDGKWIVEFEKIAPFPY
ncbi:MAG: glycoside hydrolase family 65 [Clostridiales bacterium]|nr:glycoside hydrolase family 65 [Clostridiales bacterium]